MPTADSKIIINFPCNNFSFVYKNVSGILGVYHKSYVELHSAISNCLFHLFPLNLFALKDLGALGAALFLRHLCITALGYTIRFQIYKKWYTYSIQGCERYLEFLAKVLENFLVTFACWTIYKGYMICD
jgi:hypothetical protein